MTTYRVIGQPVPKTDVQGKVTGAAVYAMDVRVPGMLWAKLLRSPVPHARIVSIDTSKAEQAPGVRLVLTGADVPAGLYGRRYCDLPVLARDVVRFVGDRVSAVAGDDEESVQRAIEFIEVEYEELPTVFDPVEAIQEGAPVIHPAVQSYSGYEVEEGQHLNVLARDAHEKGDVDAGFASADVIVENTFSVPRTHQAYIEPHCSVALVDSDGILQLWAPNKNPHGIRNTIASAVGLPPEKVVLNPVQVGGDFGGKGATLEEPIVCLLAMRTGTPVKMIMDHPEELTAAAPRHAGVMTLKTGVNRDGEIVAHEMYGVFDGGAYGGVRPGAPLGGAAHGGGLYKTANARAEILRVYTNNLPGGQARSPGEPQGFFAAESHIDSVARAIGMDPAEFRLRNVIKEGDTTMAGDRLEHVRAKETLEAALQAADYSAQKGTGVGRGVAMAFRGTGTGESAARITLNPDGTVVIGTPVFEQGTGTYTIMRQVVAEELGLDPEELGIEILDTAHSPFDSGIGGSRGTNIVTGSMHAATQAMKQEMGDLAAEALGWPSGDVDIAGPDLVFRSSGERRRWPDLLTELGRSVSALATFSADRAPVTGFVAQVAEVHVDSDTGRVDLRKLTTAHDVGRIINPIGHQGQINGGVMQGVGYGLMEEVVVEDGRVTTTNFADFKIPNIEDIPELRTVLLDPETGVGPYGIKGIGENPLTPVAPAIANAVEDAVGVRVKDLPVSAEKVFSALRERDRP